MTKLCDPIPVELTPAQFNELTGNGLTGRMRIEVPKKDAVVYRLVNLSPPDAREVCSRLKYVMLARNLGPMDGAGEIMRKEPTDAPFVCVALNHETKDVQFSTAGLNVWEFCKAMDDVIMAINVGLYSTDIAAVAHAGGNNV